MVELTLQAPFRAARKADARALAELINEAGEGLPMVFWRPRAEAKGCDPFDFGASRAAREGDNFSYENAVVVEDETGNVAAMMLAYRLEDAPDPHELETLPDLLSALVALEHKAPGTLYINAIAAYPAHRGKGLGSRLIALAGDMAREAGCAKVSLIASEKNTGAVRLYQRLGFEEIARTPIPAHPELLYDGNWLLMTKEV